MLLLDQDAGRIFIKEAELSPIETNSPLDIQPHPVPTVQAKKNTVLISHGRPPWWRMAIVVCHRAYTFGLSLSRYSEDGQRTSDAFVVGVGGPFCSACRLWKITQRFLQVVQEAEKWALGDLLSYDVHRHASTQTHVARQIVHKLGYVPTVIILSQVCIYCSFIRSRSWPNT
jgi:uridine kinase